VYSSRILFRYILREQVKVFLLAVAAITLVMNFGALLIYIQEHPLPLGALLKILAYHTPVLFPWIVPLAVLIAVTLTYGRLASDNEILAIQLAGLHVFRPILPAVVMGLCTAVGLAWVGDQLVPWCRMKEYEVCRNECEQILVRMFETKTKLVGGNYVLQCDSFDCQTLHEVSVRQRDPQTGEVSAIYTARSATYSTDGNNLTLDLKDITATDMVNGLDVGAESQRQSFPIQGVFLSDPDYKVLSTLEMLREMKEKYGPGAPPPVNKYEAKQREQRKRAIWIRIHRLYSLSLSALALALVGVPLGLLARQAHMLSAFFLGCLPVMLVYYPTFLMGESMASEGSISPAVGCWTPTAIMAAIGIGLLAWLFRR
jgi:lipopolysaccharide export LptBFGC system permease protein LptF